MQTTDTRARVVRGGDRARRRTRQAVRVVGSALAHEWEAVRVQWVWGGVIGVGRVVVRVGGCVVGGHFILGGCWRKVVCAAWRKWSVVWNLDLRGCDSPDVGF